MPVRRDHRGPLSGPSSDPECINLDLRLPRKLEGQGQLLVFAREQFLDRVTDGTIGENSAHLGLVAADCHVIGHQRHVHLDFRMGNVSRRLGPEVLP